MKILEGCGRVRSRVTLQLTVSDTEISCSTDNEKNRVAAPTGNYCKFDKVSLGYYHFFAVVIISIIIANTIMAECCVVRAKSL